MTKREERKAFDSLASQAGHRPKKKSRGGIRITALDALASKAVKARDKRTCQRCGIQYPEKARGLHAAHIFTRARKSTRWDLNNIVTLCYGCHAYFHREPILFHTWASQRMGIENYEYLRARANDTRTFSKDAIERGRTYLTERLKEWA